MLWLSGSVCHSILCFMRNFLQVWEVIRLDNENITVVPEEEVPPAKNSWQKETVDWIVSIAIAVVLAFIIKAFLFTLVNVSGTSMTPTLADRDKLFVTKLMYKPAAGDIVILKPPTDTSKHYVKRVIATAGMTVDIDPVTHDVSVDGTVLDEPYITGKTTEIGHALTYPYTVKEGEVFVLGDNRNPGGSLDSRALGPIPEKNVDGKVVFRLLPLSSFGSVYEK